VLSKITASDAGVTATFDSDAEKVVLTQKTAGSSQTITLENDTSGFLGATKLSAAVATAGQETDADQDKHLADASPFSSIQSGTMQINGVDISVDVDSDSLNDVISRINSSGAGVTVSLDDSTGRVSLLSNSVSAQLELDSNGTEFFSALEISDKTYNPTGGKILSEGLSRFEAYRTADEMKNLAGSINAIFDDTELEGTPSDLVRQIRSEITNAISQNFDSKDSRFNTNFGVNFDFEAAGKEIFDFSTSDRRKLTSAMIHEQGSREVHDFIHGPAHTENTGLKDRLFTALTDTKSDLAELLGKPGLLVNLSV